MSGMPRKSWLSLLLAPLFAMSAHSLAAQTPTIYQPEEPSAIFTAGVEYLIFTRDADISAPGNFIGGPDAGRLNFGSTEFDYTSGVRAFLAVSNDGVRVEGIYSNFGNFDYSASGSLTAGLSFDEGITGDWTGENFIDLTTGFSSLHGAAASSMGGDTDEFEGLGPSATFAADTLPTYDIFNKSSLEAWELNVVSEDNTAFFQFGAGYSNVQLDESAGVAIRGTLRAVDNVGPNNGLSHGSLITFGNMTHMGGVADGFEDELGNASGLADSMILAHSASTSNDLNGIQLIFRKEVMYWRGWVIDGTIKTGLYHNRSEGQVLQQFTGTDPGPGGDSSTYGRLFRDTDSGVAMSAAFALQSNFPLSERWSLLSGYEALLIHGVALAPEQYQNVGGPTFVGQTYNVNNDGQIIAHGANVGLQFVY